MKSEHGWAKGALIALIVALAIFVPAGLAFADHVECEQPWLTDGSEVPAAVLDEICYATNAEVGLAALEATVGGDVPQDVLEKIRFWTSSEAAVAVPRYALDPLSWIVAGSNVPESVLQELHYWANPEVTPNLLSEPSVSRGEQYWRDVLERDYGFTP